ncbi:MAG: iron ABC transporter permease [Candidatus Heimdallarchaeota archaeon]|nr:MAG: iron ABC transporter permease [Candidatus Heimdallarchaeota archaeon]
MTLIPSSPQQQFKEYQTRFIEFVSKPIVSYLWYFFIILFFISLVLFPTIFVLIYAVLEFTVIQSVVLSNPTILSEILEALLYSIIVSVTVTIIDLFFGLPIAWILVRKEFRFKSILNSIIELPLAVPTAGLGFSVALFWGVTPSVPVKPFLALDFIQDALPILVLFHFTTTFPYVVRSLAAILDEIDITLEIAARTCGASKFTAARTVTLPLFRSGVATAMVLSLAKSLSDTGGVMTVLATISSLKQTGTVLIGNWKGEYKDAIAAGEEPLGYLLPGMAFVSVLMIGIALFLVFLAKILAKQAKLPFRRVFPSFEWRVSEGTAPKARSILSFGFLVFFVLIPSFFLIFYIFQGVSPEKLLTADWLLFGQSILLSVVVAAIATLVNVGLGVPMAILITRKNHFFSRILDALVDIPYVVPSAALGFSVGLFWTTQIIFPTNEFFFVIMAHISMTFPFIVRNTIGGLAELDPAYEDAARSLGARPIQTFRHVTFPVVKFSIIAGAIMSFTRSIGETGATLAVSPESITAPVFIVALIKGAEPDYFFAALTTVILILISSLLIFVLRAKVTKKGKRTG